MTITIGNRRNGDKGVYIGRPSPLGNPFAVGLDGTREQVVGMYRNWFHWNSQNNPSAKKELDRLLQLARNQDLCLVCWCHPLPCHAQVIKEYLEDRLNDRNPDPH